MVDDLESLQPVWDYCYYIKKEKLFGVESLLYQMINDELAMLVGEHSQNCENAIIVPGECVNSVSERLSAFIIGFPLQCRLLFVVQF